MRYLLSIILFVAACKNAVKPAAQVVPPNILIVANDSSLHNNNGTWLFKGALFNGYIIERDSDKMISKLPIINGKENGVAYGWFKNGKRKFERSFLNGNREGIHKSWYANDTLAFEYFFHDDKFEGEQRTFFQSGKIWQSLNYKNGYEEGKQKSWNESGRVVNNFTVKNRKLYGVVGRYDCMSVIHK